MGRVFEHDGVMETSASFEARSAPSSYPTQPRLAPAGAVRVLLPLRSVPRMAEDAVAADKEADAKLKPTKWLDAAERISRVVSIAAIPVVLAVGGWIIQRQFQNQTVCMANSKFPGISRISPAC
jgi:hypothetical protein